MEAPEKEEIGKSQLSLREALMFFALQSLRLRLGRMLVVLLGIVFAISFLSVLLGTETIMAGIGKLARNDGSSGQPKQSFQRWWMVVAVLIATVGITNAVLMSVTERIKEIGTLKCLGARALHIVEIFLFETLLLGGAGGFLGGILGVALTVGMFWLQLGDDVWKIFGWGDAFRLIGISVGVSLVISLVAAVVPVLFAARVDPAEAMRYDV